MEIEAILKKITNICVCYYCMSTEIRFIEEANFLKNPNLNSEISDS